MATASVNVTGKVLKPNGSGVDGGKIKITLVPAYGTIDDAGTEHVIGGTFEAVIGTDGSVDFDIAPNTGSGSITPSGSSYTAVFESADGDRWSKSWTIDVSPSSQDIGDL